MNFYYCRVFKGERGFLDYCLNNNLWIFQKQYGSEDTSTVTNVLEVVKKIKEGDLLFLVFEGKIYAVGKAIKPRNIPENVSKSNLSKVINEKKHEFFDGFVIFDDAEVYYENFEDNGLKDLGLANDSKVWTQRIDVEKWISYKDGISGYGIKEATNNDYQNKTILEINDKNYVKEKLKDLKEKITNSDDEEKQNKIRLLDEILNKVN